MVTPELKWPITNFTPSAANLLATETPCLGSATSSPNDTRIFLPRIPPASLMSAIACSAPFLSCAPKAASGPVIGPPTPNLTVSPCSLLQAATASPRPKARPSLISLFIDLSVIQPEWQPAVALTVYAGFKPQLQPMSSDIVIRHRRSTPAP